jgi:hypothetical protein
MQSHYDAAFSREMGCTLDEWHGWLPQAIGAHPWQLTADAAMVQLPDGKLGMTWQVGQPRVIALMRIPRLLVHFQFDGLSPQQRFDFMRRFDLYMQRGGG